MGTAIRSVTAVAAALVGLVFTSAPGHAGGPAPHALEFANPGPKVAFISDRDGASALYVVDLDGRNLRRLTPDADYLVANPEWSTAGDRIAFAAVHLSGGSTIETIGRDGSGERTLVRWGSSLNGWPRFSPDGERLAFESTREGVAHVYVARSDGTQARRLTSGDMEESRPSWSPDGSHVIYSGRVDDVWQIFGVSADGGEAERLTKGPQQKRSAEYSPDGRTILFHGVEGDVNTGSAQLYVRDVETGAIRQITRFGGSAGNGRWTRSGDAIVFTLRDAVGKGDICMVNPDGSGLRKLTDDPADEDQAAVSAPLDESIEISNSPDLGNPLVPPPPGDSAEDGGF